MRLSPRLRRLSAVLVLVFGPLVACGPRGGSVASAADPGRSSSVPEADPQAPTGGRNLERWLDAPYVVLVSLDGFAARYMAEYGPPTLTSLTEDGVWAPEGMVPVYPTKTFPNHYSLATGLHPARHGLVANTFYDPEWDATYRISDREAVGDGRWYGGEPLWVTAERQGMVSATLFWVGSEADVGGVRPSHWRVFDASLPNPSRVDQVLEWLAWPPEHRPHLLTLYFEEPDATGHDHGPGSPELDATVARVDRDLRRLMEGIRALPHGDQVSVVVVSDHGMDSFTPETTAYVADVLGGLEGLRIPASGTHANVWVEGGPERIERVRRALDEELAHVSAYLADETPAHLAYRNNRRIGDIVLVPDSGWMVFPAAFRSASAGFTHGWDPSYRSMRALFVAVGPRLRPGARVDGPSAVDVYPLVTELLGLDPAEDIDGSLDPWRPVLRASPVPPPSPPSGSESESSRRRPPPVPTGLQAEVSSSSGG